MLHQDAITTPFRRPYVDIDDTVPFDLYSQPYERVELQPESTPYERIEIELEIDVDAFRAAPVPIIAPAASTALRVALTISLLVCALVAGFELALLVL